jgi:2',3'-cyclic-nucleotide 2'-phosphodiesterase/3'-nucleotidase
MKLVFLHTSDIHGFVLPTDYHDAHDYQEGIGLARLSSLIKAKRQEYGADHVIVTDAGDCLQGSPLASYIHQQGQAALQQYTDVYNQINYDARCLGNHDFNFGLDYLTYYVDHNQAPILNDNILDQETGVPAFGQEYKIIEKQGLKIGLIGATTPYVPHWEPAEHVQGLKFVSAFTEIQKYARLLRPQVDLLALIYHGGFEKDPVTGQATEPDRGENEAYRMLKEIPEIDLFLTGHQHRRLNLIVDQKALVQPGYRGECAAEVIVEVDQQNKKITNLQTKLIDSKDYDPDPEILKEMQALDRSTQVWLDQPIAHLAKPARIEDAMKGRLEGAPFINLLQQMQLYFTKADLSATAVMSEKAKGFGQQVSLRDILLNYPYANQLCRVKLTGKELRQIVEYSLSFLTKDANGQIKFKDRWLKPKPMLYHFDVFYPLHYEADISKPAGQRLTKFELKGQEIEAGKVYHLAVNNYRAMGGGFYPAYQSDKIEFTLDKDYVQMLSEFLRLPNLKVDQQKNYRFY